MGWTRISKHKLIFSSKYCEFHDFLSFSSKRNRREREKTTNIIFLDLGCICVLWRVVFVSILMHMIPLLMQKSNKSILNFKFYGGYFFIWIKKIKFFSKILVFWTHLKSFVTIRLDIWSLIFTQIMLVSKIWRFISKQYCFENRTINIVHFVAFTTDNRTLVVSFWAKSWFFQDLQTQSNYQLRWAGGWNFFPYALMDP